MLNAIGLANPGRERFLAETLPRIVDRDMPVWVSVGGFTAREYAETCEQLARDDVACIELNLSCPNVDEAPESAAEIVAECRALTAKPLYAKLSPHSSDIGRPSVPSRRRAPTASASSTPCAVSRSTDPSAGPCARGGRILRSGVETGRARGRLRGAQRDPTADRRHGRCAVRTRRTRVDRVRCDARRARDDSLRRSVRTATRPRRTRRRSEQLQVSTHPTMRSAPHSTLLSKWKTEVCSWWLHAARGLVGCSAHDPPSLRFKLPSARSINAWKPSSERTTSASSAHSSRKTSSPAPSRSRKFFVSRRSSSRRRRSSTC